MAVVPETQFDKWQQNREMRSWLVISDALMQRSFRVQLWQRLVMISPVCSEVRLFNPMSSSSRLQVGDDSH